MSVRLLSVLLLVLAPTILCRDFYLDVDGSNGKPPSAKTNVDVDAFGRNALHAIDYRMNTATNANMKQLHGNAVSDPACCTAGVHLTFCFVRWENGFIHYRRVGVGETWKSLGRWIVGEPTCVAHGMDVTVIVTQGISGAKPPVISNTLRGGKPLGWKPTGGTNAREVPGCTTKGNEIYCMYRGPGCGAYIIHTVKGVWQKVQPAGGEQYSPIAAWYTADGDQFNYYATNSAYHMQSYTVQAGVPPKWTQRGTFVMTGRASVCSHGPNLIDVFTVGPGSNLLWLQKDAKGGYRWRNLGGQINYPPECIGRLNNINCFGVSPKLEFVQKTYKGGKWTKWTVVAKNYIGTPSCHFSIAGVNIISCYVRNALTMGIDAYAFVA